MAALERVVREGAGAASVLSVSAIILAALEALAACLDCLTARLETGGDACFLGGALTTLVEAVLGTLGALTMRAGSATS